MSDLMRGIPFGKLLTWIKEEYEHQGSVFGIRKEKFYRSGGKASLDWFGEKLGTVIGPAAGPHSQLAQNIIASYLAGSRFIELKTVQKMDGEELRSCVPRPCINAEDECYNVEWSTELTVGEAFDEYVKGWIALHVLAKELEIADDRDFIFNMSVGYDLEGIKTPKIDAYIEGMKNAKDTAVWQECMDYLKAHLGSFRHFTEADLEGISPCICPSITLSTLHGCPPEEIERIARYLLEEKGLVTFVKCNPTLLGYETARQTMDGMGYDYISFDDHHFKADLQFKDAVAMFHRLKELAAGLGLGFGVKLTNTFPVQIKRGELPGEEMYMSGRSLFPLTIQVAEKLAVEFNGELPVSYSGGAEASNIKSLFACNIYPITMATTILKPGGYERFKELADMLEPGMADEKKGLLVTAVKDLAQAALVNPRFLKEDREYKSRKTASKLPLYDCFKAPCKDGGCPIEQQIPEYLQLVMEERFEEAFAVIAIDNALPAVTSVICDHQCQSKCTRMDYEGSLHIRNMKNAAVTNAQEAYIGQLQAAPVKTDKRAVVIGAGPGGIAAASYLRRNGMEVTVLEKRDRPMGIVEYIIPEFRISGDMLKQDFEMAKKQGVDFRFGVTADYSVAELKKSYDYVVIATGAWKEGYSPVKEGREHLVDALSFLESAKAGGEYSQSIGRRVAVIGGGDVAMDCARVAARNPECEEAVIVYRRTREFMPAEREEIRLAMEDGVKFMELLSPVSYDGKALLCEVMELGGWDSSGRRGIASTGEMKILPFDMVIAAVGARVDRSEMEQNGISFDQGGRVICSNGSETSVPGVYVVGDCKNGPATIVKAMADAKDAARDILTKAGLSHDFIKVPGTWEEKNLYDKKGVTLEGIPAESPADGSRCLVCHQVCEICNDVCPNRANVHVIVKDGGFEQDHQIIHLDGMCNECGNCLVFCPHDGRPYKDKVTVFWTQEDFMDSTNIGFLPLSGGGYLIRNEAGEIVEFHGESGLISSELEQLIQVVEAEYPYYLMTL